ncbi:non-canonical purine NTP pyrophosphatase [Candidatus Kaiserbacteria bacterium]|nr:non-canonical purine NTP pyrophosphatase [Candidatus Kaiserbacteria bacterium]MCB9811987.1 non-canonical purine NTP pyrophosphatase [Candidatus Nomurabacteria bacterium]
MKELTLITGNPKKAEQLQKLINYPLAHQTLDLIEIQDPDVEVVAKDKALRAYNLLQKPVLVEDTSLSFRALNGLPGPFIKWFLEAIGSEGLCRLLADYEDRTVTATVCLALCDENGVKLFTGESIGTVALKPQGETDFGWNNIFIPDGSTQSWAEMKHNGEQNDTMRSRAATKLQTYLQEQYQ